MDATREPRLLLTHRQSSSLLFPHSTESSCRYCSKTDDTASEPPTTGSCKRVALGSTINFVPGVGCSVKSLSLEKIIKPIFLLDWMNHSPVKKLLHEQIRSYYLDSPANNHAVDDDCVYYQSESESKHAHLYASQHQYNALLCDVFVLGDLHLPLRGGGMELELEQKN